MKLYKIIATLALTLCLQAQAPVPTFSKAPAYFYRILSLHPSTFTTIPQIPTIPVRAIYQTKLVLHCMPGSPFPDYIKFTTMNFETYIPVTGVIVIAPDTYLVSTPTQLMPNILPGLIGVQVVQTQFHIKSSRVVGILR